MKIISPAFKDGDQMPKQYTCDGIDVNPPLEFMNVPVQTLSLFLVVLDSTAKPEGFAHWIIWNIDPSTKKLNEGMILNGAVCGLNDFKKTEWSGPCLSENKHKYIFSLFALDSMLDIPTDTTIFKIRQIIKDHIIDKAEMSCYY